VIRRSTRRPRHAGAEAQQRPRQHNIGVPDQRKEEREARLRPPDDPVRGLAPRRNRRPLTSIAAPLALEPEPAARRQPPLPSRQERRRARREAQAQAEQERRAQGRPRRSGREQEERRPAPHRRQHLGPAARHHPPQAPPLRVRGRTAPAARRAPAPAPPARAVRRRGAGARAPAARRPRARQERAGPRPRRRRAPARAAGPRRRAPPSPRRRRRRRRPGRRRGARPEASGRAADAERVHVRVGQHEGGRDTDGEVGGAVRLRGHGAAQRRGRAAGADEPRRRRWERAVPEAEGAVWAV
jgi:hypothetical protein